MGHITEWATPITNPFTRLSNKTWLHGRSENDVYTLLVDAYRLRTEDNYMYGDIDEGSLYSGRPSGYDGFCDFLDLAASRPGLLPSWWTPEKRQECEQFGMNGSGWGDLRCAVEKSDIVEHYGEPRFPMQLRMFAEQVIGIGPGGQEGKAMMQMMVRAETGRGDGLVTSLVGFG